MQRKTWLAVVLAIASPVFAQTNLLLNPSFDNPPIGSQATIEITGNVADGETVAAPERTLAAGDLLHGKYVMLQKGKRNHALLVAE